MSGAFVAGDGFFEAAQKPVVSRGETCAAQGNGGSAGVDELIPGGGVQVGLPQE